jgi:lipocalin
MDKDDIQIVRYKGSWYKVNAKPYEPTYQTFKVAWDLIRNPEISSEEAYRNYFEKSRKEIKVLYPSFRKDVE